MKWLILVCPLIAIPAFAQEIEHVTAPEWSAAMRACEQHPAHTGCDALKSRYAVVQLRVQTQLRTHPMAVAGSPDPSIIDRVMGATEHMAFAPSFGFLEPETKATMPQPTPK
jgi:hypothetical protein